MPTWYSRPNFELALLAVLRAALAPAVTVASLVACARLLQVPFTGPYVALAIISALLCLSLVGREQFQQSGLFTSGLTLAGRIGLGWLAVVGVLLLLGYATKTSEDFSRRCLLTWFAVTPVLLVLGYLLLRHALRMAMLSSSNARRAVIVGVNDMSKELARLIRQRPELGLQLRAIFDDEPERLEDVHECGCELRAGVQQLPEFVNENGVDVVFIAMPTEREGTRALLRDLQDTTSSVYLIPDISIFDLIQARSDDIHGVPVIALCESPFQGVRGFAKRATDVGLTTLLLLLSAPVMIAAAIAIKLTSKGPVIFRQHRYGLEGERITVYKFRTMTVTEDGAHIRQATRDDPRVTPVGRVLRRTSLDELPQLFNVLQGRMSLVGPRPHAVAHNEEYRKLISGYMVRHKVTPGITGLAQINGYRGETKTLEDMRRRVEYDLEYIRQWRWLLDIKILWKTCAVLLKDEHAY